MRKTLTGSIIFVIVLVGLIAVLESGGSDTPTAVTKITAAVPPCVDVSVPADICIWELKPSDTGIYTKKGVLKVMANTDWKVTVKNTDEVNDGHMTEWTGSGYASKKLRAPLKVSADREVTLPEGGTIRTGTTAGENEIEVTLTQVVSKDDPPLEDGHFYRIALSFEGSSAV